MAAMPHSLSRRRFLKTSAAIAGGSCLPDWFLEESRSSAATPQKPGPNDKPGIALIGCGGRGRVVAKQAAEFGNVVAVCDVDETNLAQAAQLFPGATAFKDFRKILDSNDIHVIVNATPDHWHTLINLRALKSSKDVYSEKPLTLTIEEGQRLVQTVRNTRRILQTGSQQRSDKKFRLACELVRNGRIGKIRNVIVGLPDGAPQTGPFPFSTPPKELNWDFWLGQAPWVEYVKERCHYTFRWWYDYSGGMLTDWGAHHNDIVLWGLNLERSGPVSISSKALSEPIPGGYTAIARFKIDYTYANGVTHTCATAMENGVKFEGTSGWIFVSRKELLASQPEIVEKPLPATAQRLYTSDHHMGNFFDSLRTRKAPVCEAEIGHRSASICHLGAISLRLDRALKWNPSREKFEGDREATTYLAREQRKPWNYEQLA